MGSCLSFLSSSKVYCLTPTAKLILGNGELQEFSEPVKVAEFLKERTGFFVCHSDSMDFDEYLCPLPVEEELQLDQLYFLLPLTKLKYRVPASDLAAMAMKAGAALQRSRYELLRCDLNIYFAKSNKSVPSQAGIGESSVGIRSETLKRNGSNRWRSMETFKRIASGKA